MAVESIRLQKSSTLLLSDGYLAVIMLMIGATH